jgi:CHAT domain-containing protein/Tfp pilus assembly protein PilF
MSLPFEPSDLGCKSIRQNLSIFALMALALLNIPVAAASGPGEPAVVSLAPGKAIECGISGDETQSYAVTLAAGQYARVVVDQRGVDVVVVVYRPDGSKLFQIDSPNHDRGFEPVSLVADPPGTYRVEVKSQTKPTGRYEIKLEQLRVSTEQDRIRVAALKLSMDAKALRDQRTADSLQHAIEKYHAAINIWRTVNDELMEAYMLHEIGLLYGDTGDYQKALDAYEQAGRLYKTLGIRRGEASILSNTAWVYGEIGDDQKTLETYDQVATIYRTIGDVDPVTISNIGSEYARLGEYKRALDTHQRVLAMRRATGDPRQAITLSNIGNCYDHLGEMSKAIDFYNQAIALRKELNYDYYIAKTLNNLGVLYRRLGQQDKALDYLNQALALRRIIGDPKGMAATLSQFARLERDRGHLIEARRAIESALELVESQRSKIGSPQLRATYFGSMQQYREFYIDLLMRLHKETPSDKLFREAFNASETGRARSLLELLGEAGSEIRHGVDPALLERERTLGESIADKAASQVRLFGREHTEDEANAAAKEIATLTTEYEQVQGRIRATSPQYAALTHPVPLTVDEIQARVLDPDTLLLEYSLGEEKSFVWAVTPESIKSFELPKRAEIEPVARRVYELLTTRNTNVAKETLEQRRQRLKLAEAQYQKAAANLSQILLKPIASELKNKRLLVVSDGVLQFIPFAGLPDPGATDSRPLIIQHEIVTAPSASVVALLRQETADRKPAPKTLAVLADPVFSNDDPRVSAARLGRSVPDEKLPATEAVRSASELGLGDLRRLRFTRQEADEIARLANGEFKLEAVDFAANRKLATSGEIGQYRVVHFATHGLINNQHPELSGIVLSLVDENGQPQNGFLRLYDLYNLKLSADLVVLSACQTALGKEIRGEGLVGLTRGFMYAGAPRVVASLWQIDDRASAEFMKRFYQGMLGQKLRPAAALRAAQVSMQSDKRWHEPHYWAAFTLQGEWK